MSYDVGHDIEQLVAHIKRLSNGENSVKFKTLFDDDAVANSLESLAGTLKAAKKKGIVGYESELLLQGVSDNVQITLKES